MQSNAADWSDFRASVIFQDAGCIHVPVEWTPLKHTWLILLSTSIENIGKKKKSFVGLIDWTKNMMLSVHILYLY